MGGTSSCRLESTRRDFSSGSDSSTYHRQADLHRTASQPGASLIYPGRNHASGSGEGPGWITGQSISKRNANKVPRRRQFTLWLYNGRNSPKIGSISQSRPNLLRGGYINTFAASYLNTQGLNNSCLKSPASTLVDLTFQSRALRSFSLNQLRNLSL